MGVADKALPLIAFKLFQKKDFHRSTGRLFGADEPSWNDLCVISHKDIIWTNVVDDVMKFPMQKPLIFPIDDKEATFITLLHRGLGNKFFRKVIVE